MKGGEFFTRVTIWIAILGYAVGTVLFALSRRQRHHEANARRAWTLACVALLTHIGFAFHYYHGWSHAAAYRDTARETLEVFGLNSGFGLYINYVLAVVWILDVVWWWQRGLGRLNASQRSMVAVWHGLLLFIVFNATVIFETGFVRWAGLVICLCIALIWWRHGSAGSSPTVRKGVH